MASAKVRFISECFVKPEDASATQKSKLPVDLSLWDLALLSANYIQKGLLFQKPSSVLPPSPQDFIHHLLQRLKRSLSLTLVHFYPLAGRLVTRTNENPHSYCVSVDCEDGPGVKLVHAALDMTVSDILSPVHVPSVVRSFFDLNGAVNHDGHALPLLSVQVTDLVDGVFLGLSLNHSLADGTSFWHFFNSWSEIFQQLDRNPSISAMDGMAIISVRPNHKRWFPDGYGAPIDLPFKHHGAISDSFYNDQSVRKSVQLWLLSPTVFTADHIIISDAVHFGSSHRFDKYGPQFGMGKAVAVRSGAANKFDGKVSSYPGRQGDGSIDLEIIMSPIAMNALASDEEFMTFVSSY